MEFTQIINAKLNDKQKEVWKGNSPFASSFTVNDFSAYKKKRINYIARLELEKDEYNGSLDTIKEARKEIEQKKERRKEVFLFFLKLPILPIILIYSLFVKLFELISDFWILIIYSVISIIFLALSVIGSLFLFPLIFKSSNTIADVIMWGNFSYVLIHSIITYIAGIKSLGYADGDDLKTIIFIKLIDFAMVSAFMIGTIYATKLLQTIFNSSVGFYGVLSIICHFVLIITSLVSYVYLNIREGFECDYCSYFNIIMMTGINTLMGIVAYVFLAFVLGISYYSCYG